MATDAMPLATFARGDRRERIALDLFGDEDFASAPLDLPARDRRERRRAQRFAGAETETGVVPRTTHGVTLDHAVRERAAVVRARRADGDEVVAQPREQYRLALRVAEQLCARLW